MKKSILIAALLLSAATAFCQAPAPVAPSPATTVPAKPTFKPDMAQPSQLDIKFKLPGYVVYDYLLYNSTTEDAINHANDISSARATEIRENHKRVADSLNSNIIASYNNFISSQQKKFTADTLAAKKGGIKK